MDPSLRGEVRIPKRRFRTVYNEHSAINWIWLIVQPAIARTFVVSRVVGVEKAWQLAQANSCELESATTPQSYPLNAAESTLETGKVQGAGPQQVRLPNPNYLPPTSLE